MKLTLEQVEKFEIERLEKQLKRQERRIGEFQIKTKLNEKLRTKSKEKLEQYKRIAEREEEKAASTTEKKCSSLNIYWKSTLLLKFHKLFL